MPAKGTGHEYHFANLSFRARETTTFAANGHIVKSGVGGKVRHNNLGRTSKEALSQPGRVTGPSGHFLFAHLYGKIALYFGLQKSTPDSGPH